MPDLPLQGPTTQATEVSLHNFISRPPCMLLCVLQLLEMNLLRALSCDDCIFHQHTAALRTCSAAFGCAYDYFGPHKSWLIAWVPCSAIPSPAQSRDVRPSHREHCRKHAASPNDATTLPTHGPQDPGLLNPSPFPSLPIRY